MYRKNSSNPTAGQATPLPYTPIEDTDISKTTNRFTTNTQYDDAGNVIQDTKYRNSNFWYDANGRMYKTTGTASSGQSNAVYDASGQRVAQQIDGVWQFYIYDVGGKKVAEYGGAQAQDEGGIRYIFTDWQGSTRAITGEGGVVQARMDYTAFGEEINANVGMRTTVQGFNAPNTLNQKYALTERDKATGLDHTWWRKNENQAGRWTSPDPYNGSMSLGDPQSFNRYSYVNNQPTNFVDPSGLQMRAVRVCRTVGYRTAYVDGQYDSTWEIQACETQVVWVDDDGGGIEVGGGSGGAAQGKPSCTINVKGKGSLNKKDKLRTFWGKNKTKLGPFKAQVSEGIYAKMYRVEIYGKVKGTSDFSIHQQVNRVANLYATLTIGQNNELSAIPPNVGPDGPDIGYFQIDKKSGEFFSQDFPRVLNQDQLGDYRANFNSYIQDSQGNVLCEVHWHVEITAYKSSFGIGWL